MAEAKSLVLQAEMALCEGNQEQLRVHEKTVAFAREFEEQALQLHRKDLVPRTTVMRATSKRLDAEIALERARGK
jgi:outer membrane protein TolC